MLGIPTNYVTRITLEPKSKTNKFLSMHYFYCREWTFDCRAVSSRHGFETRFSPDPDNLDFL